MPGEKESQRKISSTYQKVEELLGAQFLGSLLNSLRAIVENIL